MKKTLLITLTIITLLFLFYIYEFPTTCKEQLREGDIIFQTSKSRQSKFIAWATLSFDTHCGIVIYQNNKPYVLEASSTTRLTPVEEFCNKGLFDAFRVYRCTEKPVKITYKQYLGLSYDSQFNWSDKKYYCSELVWKIYKKQLGIELCKPQPLSEYMTIGLKKILKERNINENSLFVAPSDISSSKLVHRIN